jgi:two-component system response regulator HydG
MKPAQDLRETRATPAVRTVQEGRTPSAAEFMEMTDSDSDVEIERENASDGDASPLASRPAIVRPMSAPNGAGRILLVDDEQDKCEMMKMLLERQGHAVTALTSPLAAIDLVGREDFDVILTDVVMSEMSGLHLCERLLGTKPDQVIVVVTGQGNLETAIGAMRTGAFDFLVKPVEPKLFSLSVTRALKHSRLQREVNRLRAATPPAQGVLVGDSPSMRRVYDMIERLGTSDPSVLICGESGSGKELVARALHAASARASGPFVAINCAAIPPSLIESELFGHARGAFTDAKTQRAGLFVEADRGTLLLDEIGEMPLDAQVKVLRALQERVVRPVGGNAEVPFDVRIIAATNRDLETEVFEKRFREDLYYRINVVNIRLPPLRERANDVLLLAQHFLTEQMAKAQKSNLQLTPQVAEKLLAYDWPGNVRELENSIARMVALARFDHLTVEDLPEKIRAYRTDRFVLAADHSEEVLKIEELERRYIQRVLKLLDGNKTRAAELLGLDRRTLYRKLERYEELSRTRS